MFLGLNILMSYFLHERCKFHISFIGSIVLDQLNWGQNQNYKSSNTPFQISFTQLLHLCCLAFNVSFQFFYIIHNIFQELFSITFQISFPNFHSKYFKDEWNPNGPEQKVSVSDIECQHGGLEMLNLKKFHPISQLCTF